MTGFFAFAVLVFFFFVVFAIIIPLNYTGHIYLLLMKNTFICNCRHSQSAAHNTRLFKELSFAKLHAALDLLRYDLIPDLFVDLFTLQNARRIRHNPDSPLQSLSHPAHFTLPE